jgi:hypothetical protein
VQLPCSLSARPSHPGIAVKVRFPGGEAEAVKQHDEQDEAEHRTEQAEAGPGRAVYSG